MGNSDNSSKEGEKSRRSGRGGVVVFLVFICLPMLFWSVDRGKDGKIDWRGDSLREKLSSFENSFAKLPVFELLRDDDQRFLTEAFGIGNSRVVVGDNGWLHYRADVDAVIGKGPFYEEPDSVARAPGLKPWNRPLPIIKDFVGQLERRGIDLVLVPVPTKSMAVSIDGEPREMVPAFYDELMNDLQKTGVQVIDLMPVLNQPDSYLKHDTHWTPLAMEKSARLIAEQIGEAEGLSFGRGSLNEEMSGDLVSMLCEAGAPMLYPREPVQLAQIKSSDRPGFVASDPEAPWVLLGDSFVNVFDDPSLGFPDRQETGRLGAGLASHLMAEFGRTIHVIAMNGSGATGVRKSFASLPDKVIRKKEKVIWVLSARDLLLAETPGRRAGIEWERVAFSKHQQEVEPVEGELVFTATLSEKSDFGDPETVTYPSAIYSTRFEAVKVVRGDYEFGEAHVFLWAFRDKELEPTGRLEVGKRYRLTVEPFPDSGPVAQTTRLDDFFFPDLPRLFAVSVEALE